MLGYRSTPKTFFKQSEKDVHLSEAYGRGQKMPEFAVISPDGTQIGVWMRCKDFIQDTIWGAKNNISYGIYGWRFNPKVDSVSKRYLFLGMRWGKSPDLTASLDNVKSTVENVEKQLGIPLYQRTRFSRIIPNKGGDYFVVYGSPSWMRCIGTVSFFTWLLRASLTNTGKTLDSIGKAVTPVSNDRYYLRGGDAFIKQLFNHGFESFKPDWGLSKVGIVHHNGFVQYSGRIKAKKPTVDESKLGLAINKIQDEDDDDFDEDDEGDDFDPDDGDI